LKYLLDTHFLGNKSQIPKYKNRNYQTSYEDWEIADKIVTEERVRWAISLFVPFKSSGIDNIYPALIQKGIDIILQPIIKIFRACIALQYIPISWRTSRVVFVPKPGRTDYTTVTAFRPISLMSFLLKTLERLVDRFIRDDNLMKYPLNENQHAYITGKSTDTALHVLVGKQKKLYIIRNMLLAYSLI